MIYNEMLNLEKHKKKQSLTHYHSENQSAYQLVLTRYANTKKQPSSINSFLLFYINTFTLNQAIECFLRYTKK